jgi:microcompartment protein CcmK/EutM
MQQACESSGGETGEVVRNDEVGTGLRGWHLVTEATAAMSAWELHRRMMSMEGR